MGFRVLCAIVLVSLIGFTLHVRGGEWEVIQSGSMRPEISVGSVVFIQPHMKYEVSDIVTFYSPRNRKERITHRIYEERRNSFGYPQFKTKGDANINGDSWTLGPENIVGKVRYHIPIVGYVVQVVRTPIFFVLFMLVTFLLMVIPEALNVTTYCAKKDE